MATLKGPGSPGRGPSYKGRLIVDTYRGQIRVRSWPKKQKRPLHATTQEHVAWFREANWLAKYVDPKIQNLMKAITVNTPWYPRDILLMLMAGRAYSIGIAGERTYYSEAQVSDVSQSLDILGDQPGMVALRGQDYWQGFKAPAPGYFLVSGPVGQVAAWTASTPSPFAGARARRTTPQSITAATDVTISWQTADFDTSGIWSAGAPTRLTVPENVSFAEITFGMWDPDNVAGQLVGWINDQDGNRLASQETDTAGGDSFVVGTGPVAVEEGNWFDCHVFCDPGRSFDANTASFVSIKLHR